MDFNAHFGLRKTPFTREVAVSDMYAHPQRDEVLDCLVRAVQQRMSAGLEAPAGLGKTAMIRALCDALADVRYHVHYVKVTGLSKRDMCREIAKSLDLPEAGSYPRLVRLVQEAVETRSQTDGTRTVLILDDAHELRPDVLAMFKLSPTSTWTAGSSSRWSWSASRSCRSCFVVLIWPTSPSGCPGTVSCGRCPATSSTPTSSTGAPSRGPPASCSTIGPARRSMRWVGGTLARPTTWRAARWNSPIAPTPPRCPRPT